MKAAARPHLSPFLLPPPDGLPHPWRRQSSPAGLIRIRPWGGRIRALGVRICPLGPRCAGERRWRQWRGLTRSFGWLRCGSLAAAVAAGRTPVLVVRHLLGFEQGRKVYPSDFKRRTVGSQAPILPQIRRFVIGSFASMAGFGLLDRV
jgi:hypothetical protein